MSQTALVFPGQGSQYPAMGQWLEAIPAARAIFDRVESAGFPFRKLVFEEPEELDQTEITQPALFTVEMAVWSALLERGIAYDAVAGHSLGEHSALVAAGVLELEEGLQIVRERGRRMGQAARESGGSMLVVLGLEEEEVLRTLCAEASTENETVTIANYNSPGQVVLSGHKKALERAAEMATLAGARRLVPIRVSGAFHSPLMAPAVERFAEYLSGFSFRPPRVRFYPNVTAEPESDPERIREHLIRQIVSPVRWTETIRNMSRDGIRRFVEVGPGRVLAGLVRRTAPQAEVWTTDRQEQLDEVIRVLATG
ncbi:MAG: malonyl CoA-acyl carrier protein transacylase [Candidatus Poribacteria bacterium]|nr:MAG: malonyl CoA-acyl carrier protein transacylase [Candidatus Poribacteria bacterium]